MNIYDTKMMEGVLEKEGYKVVSTLNEADVIIVNTCSVREHAEKRAMGRIANLKGLKKFNPNLLIGVTGCMAQRLGGELNVDFVVGTTGYTQIHKIIEQAEKEKIVYTQFQELHSNIFPLPKNTPSSFLPIMRGCSNFCAYCVVPYLRGRVRSRNVEEILEELEELIKRGVKEVILLGQSVNQYFSNGVNFAELLKKISLKNIRWVKFTTSHPKYMSEEILKVIASSPNLCEWFHLPLQAGSNRILKLMKRKYTKEEYLELIYKIREKFSSPTITTDIMVGFPSETDYDFDQTLATIKEVEFDFAYMFKYSDRPMTEAQKMRKKVPEEEKKRRLKILIEIQNQITKKKNSKLVGSKQEVLIIKKSRKGNLWLGRTRNNKHIVVNGNIKIGDVITVEVEKLIGWTPYGRKM